MLLVTKAPFERPSLQYRHFSLKKFIAANERFYCNVFHSKMPIYHGKVIWSLPISLFGGCFLLCFSYNIQSLDAVSTLPLDRLLHWIYLKMVISNQFNHVQWISLICMIVQTCAEWKILLKSGLTFSICWITLHELKFFRSAMGKKNHQGCINCNFPTCR